MSILWAIFFMSTILWANDIAQIPVQKGSLVIEKNLYILIEAEIYLIWIHSLDFVKFVNFRAVILMTKFLPKCFADS